MSTPEQQIIAKLHYMGRQYGNGQMARGGPSGKHYLTEAAEMLESLIAERAALSRQVAVAWGLTATETKRTDMDKPTLPQYLSQLNDIAEVAKAYGEAMAAWGVAQERKALLDCRTCRQHTTVSGGCMSVLQCVEGSAYQPTNPRRVWEIDRDN